MSGHHELTADVDIDIAGLLRQVWRKKWLLLAFTLVTGISLLFLLSGIEPRYKSDARIIIENRESQFTRRGAGDNGSGGQFDEQAVGSQVEILTSDDLALRVISDLNLVSHPEFRNKAEPSLIGTILDLTGLSAHKPGISPEERVLGSFRKKLTVYASPKSRVIYVEFSAEDPSLAQSVPNALSDRYMDFIRQAKQQSTQEATSWLGPEIDELREKLREAEAKVAEFRSNSDILLGNNNALLSTQQLSEASSELSRVRSEKLAAQGKVRSVRDALDMGGSLDVIPEVIASSLIQRLREREVALDAQISELSTTLLPNHPRLKALKSQAVNFQGQIRTAARNILKSLENNVDLFAQQEKVLLKQVNQLKAEASRVGEAEVELRALEREAAAQRELLETYLTQYREAASRQNRDYFPVDARIISRAIMPANAYFPKVMPLTIAGMVVVFALSVIMILTWALMTGKAYKPAGRVTAYMIPENLHTLRDGRKPGDKSGTIPTEPEMADASATTRIDIVSEAPLHPDGVSDDGASAIPTTSRSDPRSNTEPDKGIAANDAGSFAFTYAYQAIVNMGAARVAVLSPGGDIGSMTSWLLARTLANNGKSVIVVDLTGSSVTSIEFLGTSLLPGLREMLTSDFPISKAVHTDRLSKAHILPGGTEVLPIDDVSLEGLGAIAQTLEAEYDFTIFDCGLTGADGLGTIADERTLILVSKEGANVNSAAQLEQQVMRAGYPEAITIRLEQSDREKIFENAA